MQKQVLVFLYDRDAEKKAIDLDKGATDTGGKYSTRLFIRY